MTVGQPLDVHHHEVTSFPRWLVVDERFQFVCPRRMEGDLTNAAILIDRWSFFDEDTTPAEVIESLLAGNVDGMIISGIVILCGPSGHACLSRSS